MRLHRLTALAGALTTLAISTTAAAEAAPLIAPLDVRVTAEVRPGSVLRGVWNVASTDEGGVWIGPSVKLTESWRRGARSSVRVRGRADGGPERVHYLELNYLQLRRGEGVLREERPEGDTAPPLLLQCLAQGAEEPGGAIITGSSAGMQVVDQPRRNRVIIRGPGIAFIGPRCQRAGAELPVRVVGLHPPEEATPWVPRGATTRWEFSVPRAEFAAGGRFRFRGAYSYAYPIQMFSNSDVFGTALTSGKVAIDLKVTRVS